MKFKGITGDNVRKTPVADKLKVIVNRLHTDDGDEENGVHIFHNGYGVSIMFDTEIKVPIGHLDILAKCMYSKWNKIRKGNEILKMEQVVKPKYNVTIIDDYMNILDKYTKKEKKAKVEKNTNISKEEQKVMEEIETGDDEYKDILLEKKRPELMQIYKELGGKDKLGRLKNEQIIEKILEIK